MRIYYSVVDAFPAYRVDLAELFGVELSKLGLQTDWFMRSGEAVQIGQAHSYAGQRVRLAPALRGWPGPIRRLAYWLADAWGLIAQWRNPPDALQCRDKFLTSVLALWIARLLRRPFFYWCSYPFPEHAALMAERASGPKRTLLHLKAKLQHWLLYRYICPRAAHVFVQSEQMKQDMADYGVPPANMTAVPMGVPAALGASVLPAETKVKANRFIYLGSLGRIRRLETLIDAFALVSSALPDAELLFVGDGDVPSERPALEAYAARLGLENSVRFTGFLPMQDAWALAATAHVCVSPVYPDRAMRAASPTKLIEYMALGRPVVCNDHPEQSQVIADSGAGVCVPWSAEAFAAAMIRLATDSELAARCAKLGPAWVRANRSYPIIAKQVWTVYQRLLNAV
ncbi:glycosyltransferase family 4 protein [Roseateles sp.]|jgi:glycosyltransferase involved in cell wall biosynthesis|uniref:glycosyltransferase family 4 protein n=1 Tax=Roseateles sp. TaxID=1971397 RepID=UPI003919B381